MLRNCSDCGKSVKGTFIKCYGCNLKAKTCNQCGEVNLSNLNGSLCGNCNFANHLKVEKEKKLLIPYECKICKKKSNEYDKCKCHYCNICKKVNNDDYYCGCYSGYNGNRD